MLAEPTLDAVVLATPHGAHAGQVIPPLGAGKSVSVEKPFTRSVADARAAIDAAEHAGVVLAVGFYRRFHPSMVRLRKMLREVDPIRVVTCLTTHRAAPFGGGDTTALSLSFAGGATGLLSSSVVAAPNYRMAAYETRGLGEVPGHQMGTFRLTPSADPDDPPELVETASFNMLTTELTEFAGCVADRRPFPTPLYGSCTAWRCSRQRYALRQGACRYGFAAAACACRVELFSPSR